MGTLSLIFTNKASLVAMMMIMIAIVKHPLKFTLLIIQPGPSDVMMMMIVMMMMVMIDSDDYDDDDD